MKKIKYLNNYMNKELVITFLSWITLFTSLGLIYFQTELHSDILFLDDLMHDLFIDPSLWSDWKLTPAPAYFPDMLLYAISYNIFSLPESRIFFVVVAQALFLVLTLIWLAKIVYEDLSKQAEGLIIMSVALSTWVASNSQMWLYFNTANNHFSVLLLSLLLSGLTLKFLKKPNILLAILIITVAGLGKASSSVLIISFLAPMVISLIMALLYSYTSKKFILYRKSFFYLIILFFFSLLFAVAIDIVFTYNNPMSGRTSISLDAIKNSLDIFLDATKIAFSTENLYTFTFSMASLLSFIYLLFWLFKTKIFLKIFENIESPNHELKDDLVIITMVLFLIVIVPVNVTGSILSGGIIDIFAFRYFMFPIALSLFITIIIFDKKKYISVNYILVISLIASIIIMYDYTNQFKTNKNLYRIEARNSAKCVNELINSGVDLKSGVAEYEFARGVEYQLPEGHKIDAITNDLNPFFWMSSIGHIIPNKSNLKRNYNFVILRNIEYAGPFDFTPLTIGKLLPIPDNRYLCKEIRAQIWHYKNNDFDKIVKAKQSLILFKEKIVNRVTYLGSMFHGTVGQTKGTFRVASEKYFDAPGLLIYGPYINLEQGKYSIRLNYSAATNNNSLIGTLEIGRFNTPEQTNKLYSEVLKEGKNNMIDVELSIKDEVFTQLETRIHYNGSGELKIHSIDIVKK